MSLLRFDNLIPHVFTSEDCEGSQVWLNECSVSEGERVLIEAGSGRGKSSLLSFIYGQRSDFSGTITFMGKDIRHLSLAQWDDLRRHHISILFQDLRLFPELTAYQNVEIKNSLTNHKTKRQIEELFECLGITHRISTPVAKMSYGQQQRVALIRALCQPFKLFLADEPISHLDDENGRIMAELIHQEATLNQASVLVTSIGKHFDMPYTQTLKL